MYLIDELKLHPILVGSIAKLRARLCLKDIFKHLKFLCVKMRKLQQADCVLAAFELV